MSDSSSSSDEEEKAKLKSATWHSFTSVDGNKDARPEVKSRLHHKKSLRNLGDAEDEQRDFRNVDATPEVKAFIAKKLTSWLDSSIAEIDKSTTSSTSRQTQKETNDDFQLFSTSKPGLAVDDPQPMRQRRRPPSSSDSDSEEERRKLASVAVSYDQVVQSIWPPPPPPQVTSNLSPTNPSPNPSTEQACRLTEKKSDSGICEVGEKRKKRKKKKTGTPCDLTAEENNLSAVLKTSQDDQSKERISSTENGNGTFDESPSPREQTNKKKKKRKRNRSNEH